MKIYNKGLFFNAGLCIAVLITPSSAFAMHISEGILPFNWALIWFAIAIPFVAYGIWCVKIRLRREAAFKPLVGLISAVVFIISCMPVPVPIAGTCSHPCGVGISAILVGPVISVLVAGVALLLQALFLAHGGLTTWGANVVSMGIAGSFAAYLGFVGLQRLKVPLFFCGFAAGVLADWATYMTTSLELALSLHGEGQFLPLFITIMIAFIPTQLPLGILEGFLTGGMIVFVAKRREDILVSLGVIKNKTKTAVIHSIVLLTIIIASPTLANSEGRWSGVDESVIEKVAEECERPAWTPFINTDQGDILLFVFLLAGAIGGFIAGVNYQRLFGRGGKSLC